MDMRRWAIVILSGMWVGSPVGAVMSPSSPSGEEVFRLNCGAVGWDFTDPRGNFWLKDEGYSSHFRWGYENGHPADAEGTGVVISTALTDITPVYRTSRWGGTDMRYRAELPNGQYMVTLHFAETYWASRGARVFDVALQGKVVLKRLDVLARAGGQGRPFSRSFPVTVSNETVEVSFPTIYADNAMISGIEVKAKSVTNDAVLAFFQRKMFWFFWNEAGSGTGLVSDKSNNFFEQDFPTASIASTGFGLSAITVAAERGWITPAEARQRVHTTLDFFRTMQLDPARSYHGFWFHFVNWNTGERDYASEVSTVDSALFILGALQAGEYFRSTDSSIAEKAEQMYKDMEWNWFVGRGSDTPFVSMGWTPEMQGVAAPDRGSFIRAWWDMYAESVFVNLLALGSPTYPIETKAWVDMRRHGSFFAGGGIYEYMHLPPLFVHQYHNLFFDFRDKHDGMADYWEAAIRATQRDRAQCAADSRYEPDIWGLTACATQYKGYQVYGSEPDGSRDGTAAPTGPLASLPMTPTESMASGRKMFFQYKHAIWGRHGFTDSFSTSANERADDALSLDNGPIVLAIENYRSDLIRRTFMQSPYARAGLNRAGFGPTGAAPRYYSQSEVNGNHARFAFDGNPATRWESISDDGQWLAVDFGKPTPFDYVRLVWETAHGKDYRIQTSEDGQAWTAVATVIDGDGGEDLVRFPKTTARYLRMFGDRRGGVGEMVWGFSLFSMDPGVGSLPPMETPRVAGRTNASLSWVWIDKTDNETGFLVREVPDNNVLGYLPANTTGWAQLDLGVNTGHQIKVEAFNSIETSTSPASPLSFTLANSPQGTKLTRSGQNLILSWEPNGNPPHTEYRAYLALTKCFYLRVYGGNERSTPVVPLPGNLPSVYIVRAQNGNGIPTAFDVPVSTRVSKGSLRVLSDSPVADEPTSTEGGPPLTVEWAEEGPGIVLMEPVDVIPGRVPESWQLLGPAVTVTTEGVERPALHVRSRAPSNGDPAVVGKWDEASSAWAVLDPNTLVEGGVFGLFFTPPVSLGEERIFPNPFRPSRSPTLRIERVPAGTQVRLYTIAGEKVCDLPPADNDGKTSWNGQNSAGQSVAAGVYIGVLESGGKTKAFRLGVEQ